MEIRQSQQAVTKPVASPNYSQQYTCKFCLDPCTETCPCSCIGSMRYVHEQCLIAWIRTRHNLIKVAGDVHEFKCETCRQPICVTFKTKYKFVNGCRENGEEICTMLLIVLALSISVALSIVALVKTDANGEIAMEFQHAFSIILLPFQIILLFITVKLWLIDPFIEEQKQQLKIMVDLGS